MNMRFKKGVKRPEISNAIDVFVLGTVGQVCILCALRFMNNRVLIQFGKTGEKVGNFFIDISDEENRENDR